MIYLFVDAEFVLAGAELMSSELLLHPMNNVNPITAIRIFFICPTYFVVEIFSQKAMPDNGDEPCFYFKGNP